MSEWLKVLVLKTKVLTCTRRFESFFIRFIVIYIYMLLRISYHLYEIFYKFQYLIVSYVITFFISYYYSEQLIYLSTKSIFVLYPLDHFIYTSITEVFFTYIKVAIFTSTLVTLPLILFYI